MSAQGTKLARLEACLNLTEVEFLHLAVKSGFPFQIQSWVMIGERPTTSLFHFHKLNPDGLVSTPDCFVNVWNWFDKRSECPPLHLDWHQCLQLLCLDTKKVTELNPHSLIMFRTIIVIGKSLTRNLQRKPTVLGFWWFYVNVPAPHSQFVWNCSCARNLVICFCGRSQAAADGSSDHLSSDQNWSHNKPAPCWSRQRLAINSHHWSYHNVIKTDGRKSENRPHVYLKEWIQRWVAALMIIPP